MASPHPKAAMDLNVYIRVIKAISMPWQSPTRPAPTSMDKERTLRASALLMRWILLVKCEGWYLATKWIHQGISRMVPTMARPRHSKRKTKTDPNPKPSPETPNRHRQKTTARPECSPELGPLYRPLNEGEDQGPGTWPLRFFCSSGTLRVPLRNVDGCWLCTCFLPSSSTLYIPQR